MLLFMFRLVVGNVILGEVMYIFGYSRQWTAFKPGHNWRGAGKNLRDCKI